MFNWIPSSSKQTQKVSKKSELEVKIIYIPKGNKINIRSKLLWRNFEKPIRRRLRATSQHMYEFLTIL